MKIKFTRDDFNRLRRINATNRNKKLFNKSKGYSSEKIRQRVFELQQPVWQKMVELKDAISDDSYFNKRFEIKVCRRTKQSTKTTKGPYRALVWISLVPITLLNKANLKNYKRQRLPQIQISLKPERFIVASIWLEGKACEQKYRNLLLDYLQSFKLSKKYTVSVDNKKDKYEEYNQRYNQYSEDQLKNVRKNKYYSVGIERNYNKNYTIRLNGNIYSSILDELQEIYTKIFIPCFDLKDIKQEKRKVKTKGRYTRKGSTSDQVSKYFRGLLPRRWITKKHVEIQKQLKKNLERDYKWIGDVFDEKNYVDLSVEFKREKKAILYEIKTDKSALNCLKKGLGQLLFYSLITREYEKRSIELVIVGLHKIKSEEEKKFVRLLKKIMGKTTFKYQVFDEKEKELLSESKS